MCVIMGFYSLAGCVAALRGLPTSLRCQRRAAKKASRTFLFSPVSWLMSAFFRAVRCMKTVDSIPLSVPFSAESCAEEDVFTPDGLVERRACQGGGTMGGRLGNHLGNRLGSRLGRRLGRHSGQKLRPEVPARSSGQASRRGIGRVLPVWPSGGTSRSGIGRQTGQPAGWAGERMGPVPPHRRAGVHHGRGQRRALNLSGHPALPSGRQVAPRLARRRRGAIVRVGEVGYIGGGMEERA